MEGTPETSNEDKERGTVIVTLRPCFLTASEAKKGNQPKAKQDGIERAKKVFLFQMQRIDPYASYRYIGLNEMTVMVTTRRDIIDALKESSQKYPLIQNVHDLVYDTVRESADGEKNLPLFWLDVPNHE